MEMRNCPQCGRVFAYLRTNLCPACVQKDEDEFRKVRNYIAKNPGADIITVSKETGVSEERIIRYLKEGRIYNTNPNTRIKIECELCGALITQGRYCKACTDKLTAGLKKNIETENRKAVEEQQRKSGLRMYTRDIRKEDR